MPLRNRLEKLEAMERSKDGSNRLVVRLGYIQKLPADYQGPKHLVVRDMLPCGPPFEFHHEWEEVEGPAPNAEAAESQALIVELVTTAPYRLGDARRNHEAEARQEAGGLRRNTLCGF